MSDALAGFDWDEGNRKKCQKHGVTLNEIEAALSRLMRVFPDPAHSAVETRYLGIGTTAASRHVLIAFTYRTLGEERFIRPSAPGSCTPRRSTIMKRKVKTLAKLPRLKTDSQAEAVRR